IPGSDIVLDSCGTGAGEEKIVNVANAIGMMFPDSRVHAPRVSIICGKIEFDSAKPIKVRYLEGTIGYIRQAT
ncbi:hypothetical protein HZB07_01195, partial [Candidatus Saganbacteria bacterium]|nr:hypothetical protein [Candidatus Saganbacteria bacterium]